MRNQVRNAAAELGGEQPSAQAAADARKRFERYVDAVARKVDQYRIDGQRFFAGDLKLPPDDLRDEIKADLRRLQGSKLATSADTFRLSSLEARFNSQSELFGRRMREREQGGARRKAERPELQHDPSEGVVLSREGAVEALYKGLYLSSGGASQPSMDIDRFRDHLRKQAEAIRAKTGASDIQFRIAEEDGKMKIKAKPIK